MIKFKESKLPKNKKSLLRYLYKFQNELRLFHNLQGKRMRDDEITEIKFREFQESWFAPRSSLISGKIASCITSLTEKEKEQLLDKNEYGEYIGVKNKEKYKVDKRIKINIDDIEEV